MNQQNQPNSLTVLEERVAAHPGSLDDVLTLAAAYIDRGRWDQAVEAYQAAITLDTTNADLYNSLGTAWEGAGNLKRAEEAYHQAVALEPEGAAAWYNLGSLYEAQRRIPEATQAFKKCLGYSAPDEYPEIEDKLSAMLSADHGQDNVPPVVVRRDPIQGLVRRMYEHIRSWAITSLMWGGLSIFASGTLDLVWGIVMFVIAILSWKIRIPAMFVLYSAFMAWAAVMNGLSALTGGNMLWLGMAALQIYWTISIMKQFKIYRQLPLQELFEAGNWPANLEPPQQESAITGKFAVVGAIVGALALVLLPVTFAGSIILAMVGIELNSQLVYQLLSGIVDLAVLALGLAGAALLSRTERKIWAIGGVVCSVLVLIGWLLFLIVMNL